MSTHIKKLCRSGETLSIINVYDQNKRQIIYYTHLRYYTLNIFESHKSKYNFNLMQLS